MTNRKESFGELLVKAPFWISLLLGACAFCAVTFGVPAIAAGSAIAVPMHKAAHILGFAATLPFVLLSLLSLYFRSRCRRLADRAVSLESLRSMSWKSFEFLVSEVYRRQGYQVDVSLGTGPDGGVDLIARKYGTEALIQCKHWKTRAVGVSVVREMFGIQTARNCDRAEIVTSGTFTQEAVRFAERKPIALIDGSSLIKLIRATRTGTPPESIDQPASPEAPVSARNDGGRACPRCGAPMVERTARRGSNIGGRFLGCSSFPKCRHTEKIPELETVT